MRKLFIMIVGLALASGAGLVVVLEYFDTSFKNINDAVDLLGLPMLASFPILEGKRSRKKIILNNAMTLVTGGVALGLFGVIAIMSIKGVDKTLAWIQQLI
jgi:hypothetical protein